MKFVLLWIVILLTLHTTVISADQIKALQSTNKKWIEYKSDHFIVYYDPEIEKDYIREFSDRCEKEYRDVISKLGFTITNSWLFEDRAKIYLFKDRKDYLGKTGFPRFSGGAANYKGGYTPKKKIITYYQDQGFFENVLPHELTHIVVEDFIGPAGKLPLWLNEGVACSNEKDRNRYLSEVSKMIGKTAEENVLLHNDMKPEEFYSVSAAYAMFILDKYGKEKFVSLCRKLKRREPFGRAFSEIYGFKDLAEFNSAFINYFKERSR